MPSPISSCGLRLDDEVVRITVGLRLGINICEPHVYICGSVVDVRGSHALSCKHTFGRFTRHNRLNDIVLRSLTRAKIPATREPAGLLRSDGKRPDGLTLIPWREGRCLVWDVIVIVADTTAASYLPSTSISAGSAAELAAVRKQAKYAELTQRYEFVPIAVESHGMYCQTARLQLLFWLISVVVSALPHQMQRKQLICFSVSPLPYSSSMQSV